MTSKLLLRIGEMTQGEIRPVEIGGRHLLLVVGENGPALTDRRCPHAGGDLAKGQVVGNRIRCPTHGYLFNLETGVCPHGRREGWGPLAVHDLFERDGGLYVDIDE